MKFFYLSSTPNEDNMLEIHERECSNIPDSLDRDYLGPFNNGAEAIRKAKMISENVTLCVHCCKVSTSSVLFKKKS
jgi:hypothetical protein